jgi:hypothetical protein
MKYGPGRAKRWKAGFGLLALGPLALLIGSPGSPLAQAPSQSAKPDDPPTATAPPADSRKTEQSQPAAAASATAQAAPPLDPAQAQFLADTEKLLKLSQELKDEVAKTNKDTLSIAVIKKADEVEKLARSLKERASKTR